MPGYSAAGDLPCITGKRFRWINIDNPTPSALNALLAEYRFHHLDVEDCMSKTQLPKIDKYKDYIFAIFHFPRYLKEKKFSVPAQVAVFLGADFLVTVHTGELKPISQLFRKCGEDEEAHDEYLGGSPAYLLYEMLYTLVEHLMVMIGKVIVNIENIEEKVFDDKSDAVRELTELRHNIANLRRVVLSLMRVIHDLEKKAAGFSEDDISVYFGDLSDYADKAWSILDECRETVEIYKDTDFIISSDRTNKILTLLTIMFTFSIPFTVVGALYGMNVALPGGLEKPWTFWGPYTTFIIVLLASFAPVALMFFMFRRLRWL